MDRKTKGKTIEMILAGPARGNQGAAGFFLPGSLNNFPPPPVTGALGVIGLSGRAS